MDASDYPGTERARRFLDARDSEILLKVDVREVFPVVGIREGEPAREKGDARSFPLHEFPPIRLPANGEDAG